MPTSIAEVAVPRDVRRTFDYAVPEQLRGTINVGMRVRVPFRNEALDATVVALKTQSEFSGQLKSIQSAIDTGPTLDEAQLALADWISRRYLSPLGLVLQAMAPARLLRRSPQTRRHVRLNQSLADTLALIDKLRQRAPQQATLLETLIAHEAAPERSALLREVGCTSGPLKSLQAKGAIVVEAQTLLHHVASLFSEDVPEVSLTGEQHQALETIRAAIDRRRGRFLLHGINASGKTEVYLQAVQHALERNRGAVVVVPEISLTPQLIARLGSRFGDAIALYHSGLTDAQRDREWTRLIDGEAQVAVGVRAAIFAPVTDLGLIVVDEEHEATYKQDDPQPRYHAREVALKRGELEGSTVVLGSATPAVETFDRAHRGSLQKLELTERVVGGTPPTAEIVDLGGQDRVLSPRLEGVLRERLERGEQAMLLLNRRGFATCVLCRGCRTTQTCPQCEIALVYHSRGQRLVCHTCGQDYPARGSCRSCGSSDLVFLGRGTEQAEHALRATFPEARLARMDSDTVGRGEHGRLLEGFRQGEIDVLLGTQMIGLGLDFPNATLVGVLSADTLLDVPDFRSGERTFQLISQAIGRAGRGGRRGQVLIQTNHPDHYAVGHATRSDYAAFFEEESMYREALGYPPYTRLVKLTSEDANEARAREGAEALHSLLEDTLGKGTELLGPFRALPYRLRGIFRWQLVVKTKRFSPTLEALDNHLREGRFPSSIKVDVDPQSLTA
ncbi:MAG: primosomal protein N' [Candidatus Bipolaricaulia bacterium]